MTLLKDWFSKGSDVDIRNEIQTLVGDDVKFVLDKDIANKIASATTTERRRIAIYQEASNVLASTGLKPNVRKYLNNHIQIMWDENEKYENEKKKYHSQLAGMVGIGGLGSG